MKRISVRVNHNGQRYTIDSAEPHVFAEWFSGLARMMAVDMNPATYFQVESINVYDDGVKP